MKRIAHWTKEWWMIFVISGLIAWISFSAPEYKTPAPSIPPPPPQQTEQVILDESGKVIGRIVTRPLW